MAFVNLNRLLELNKDKGEAMGEKAAASANKQLAGAAGSLGMLAGGMDTGEAEGDVKKAQAKSKMLGTTGGLAAGIGGQANALDAALAGRSQAVQTTQARANNLGKMLEDAQKAYAARAGMAQGNQQAAAAATQRRDAQQAATEAQMREQRAREQALYEQNRDARMDAQDRRRQRSRNIFDFLGR